MLRVTLCRTEAGKAKGTQKAGFFCVGGGRERKEGATPNKNWPLRFIHELYDMTNK